MATSVVAAPPLILQFLNNIGWPNAGGSLLTQVGGVNYPTYQDAQGNTPLPNPIPLNSRGEVSNTSGVSCQLFLVQGVTYTFTLYDPLGNVIWTAQSVSGNTPQGGSTRPTNPYLYQWWIDTTLGPYGQPIYCAQLSPSIVWCNAAGVPV
ncbi:hypothetical protein [Burkholderia metallica]|uniref:hypothetical protein n=1 Tax=Burkholderia metallica TaxID=488729 RepID=UPI001CF234D1|nr:hypothetical protein [Burkholderia metallica]MCA8018067.1 hypothetical protein [Burkholderia metallica]